MSKDEPEPIIKPQKYKAPKVKTSSIKAAKNPIKKPKMWRQYP